MLEIDLASTTWSQNSNGTQFLPLGSVARPSVALSVNAKARIERQVAAPQADLWGTLGSWSDSDKRPFRGLLRISERGDEHSVPEQSGESTIQLIHDIRRGRPNELNVSPTARVRERFIDLSDLWFDAPFDTSYALDAAFALRLTLFVKPAEGALVVLQHGRFGEGGVEFIQPESTGNDHSCSMRDRLSYRIPLAFDAPYADANLTNGDVLVSLKSPPTRIVDQTSIKILTFERGNSTSAEVIKRALTALGRSKYQLYKWDVNAGAFSAVPPERVRRDVKTLLLLHGTFSSTDGAFGPLAQESTFSWLENMAIAQRRYGQILSFDHETVFDSLATNVEHLTQATGGGFDTPLDVISHSRGGLLTKALAIGGKGFEIERAVLVACANGVGYFRVARGLSRFLSVLYRLTRLSTVGSALVALAQHSIEAVLSLDGLKVMIPGSRELNAVAAAAVPPPRTGTVYLPVTGDYGQQLLAGDRFFKRMAEGGLDWVLKRILGERHDWVVGSDSQGILAPGSGLAGYVPQLIPSFHTTYFAQAHVRRLIQSYLLTGQVPKVVRASDRSHREA